ncbi:MAG: hypothetical protein IJ686_06605 [Bacteroidales bacterium]|nr:hypothetical protein [Bacteroidales bacterium]
MAVCKKIYIPLLLTLLAAAPSCTMLGRLKHDDKVVAKAGRQRLYLSELNKYIPDGVSQEDSINLAYRYINSWATEILYTKTAEEQLSKSQKDVTKELEEYRRSLLKYRFEQRYINERLDTLITKAQIDKYFADHKESYTLQRPILKVRFVHLMKDSPNKGEILSRLGCKEGEDLVALDSLAYLSALRYFDKSSEWMDAGILAREFNLDYATMLSQMRAGMIEQSSDDRGDIKAMYVFELQSEGVAPIEYCIPSIRENILSERKRDLLEKLEQDLLTNALDHKDFVIY